MTHFSKCLSQLFRTASSSEASFGNGGRAKSRSTCYQHDLPGFQIRRRRRSMVTSRRCRGGSRNHPGACVSGLSLVSRRYGWSRESTSAQLVTVQAVLTQTTTYRLPSSPNPWPKSKPSWVHRATHPYRGTRSSRVVVISVYW